MSKIARIATVVIAVITTVGLAVTALPGTQGPLIQDGHVVQLFNGTTKMIISECCAGSPGTVVYYNEAKDIVVYTRSIANNVGFVVLQRSTFVNSVSGLKDVTGNLVNYSTWSQLRAWLVDNGYGIYVAVPKAVELISRIGNMVEVVPVFFFVEDPQQIIDEGFVPIGLRTTTE